MREARSIVAGVFAFLVFLLCYALVSPGVAHSRRSARFLRMQVEETSGGHTESHTVSVPTFVVNGVLRGASVGRFHRQLDLHMSRDIPFETLHEAWDELSRSPEGTEVTKSVDEARVTFKKDGSALVLTIVKEGEENDGRVTLRLPLSLAEHVMSESHDLDADEILRGLRSLGKGDLVDVRDAETHVRIWLE